MQARSTTAPETRGVHGVASPSDGENGAFCFGPQTNGRRLGPVCSPVQPGSNSSDFLTNCWFQRHFRFTPGPTVAMTTRRGNDPCLMQGEIRRSPSPGAVGTWVASAATFGSRWRAVSDADVQVDNRFGISASSGVALCNAVVGFPVLRIHSRLARVDQGRFPSSLGMAWKEGRFFRIVDCALQLRVLRPALE